MRKRIIFSRPDGGVSCVTPSPNLIGEYIRTKMAEIAMIPTGGEKDKAIQSMKDLESDPVQLEIEAINFMKTKSVPDNVTNFAIVDVDVIPSDRTFRDAWTLLPGRVAITMDMPKAREIQAEKIAQAQIEESERLTIEERKASFAGRTADAAQHAARKSAVDGIDVNALVGSIKAARNTDELKALYPPELPQ